MSATLCADCGEPVRPVRFMVGKIAAASGYAVCHRCRGLRAAKVNREKAAKHGRSYFSKTGQEGSSERS